ncbi:ribonuclease H-like domain-containing protein [Paenibacillus eucommiae]|uniref:Uncharacterized protein YprB with RNaseH-like and TPR domain n=1 Tax=Paenibacillus eucommiae TaxID=1355755 RepID=A0ABS4J5V8_9BACL|nr:ribonuclease H-like domain-containing protein [Paenibacillus eucommiae]MBP1995229.1 uncharacterized protein YprB with RNaseH-like and TPR domain [Paenibacillus eucommiae]
MSSMRDRLNRLKKPEAAKAPVLAAFNDDDWTMLDAHLESNEHGSFILRRRSYSLDSCHGKYRLGELADHVYELSCFHNSAAVQLDELLFFDTETTGLGVGAGNVPFMVGIGYYCVGQFIIEQLFMRNPSEELAMLLYLQEKLERYTHIVSYNGRTFDWPILKNRYVLNRLALDDSSLRHLDLLYPSRSLWRNSLPSCRLSMVEEERLGFTRHNDVPGSLAPTLYFQYLAEKNASVLSGLFVHNEHDIVSLAALSIHFAKLLSGECSQCNLSDTLSDTEWTSSEEEYRTAVWLEKMGRLELSSTVFDRLRTALLENQLLNERNAEVLLLLAAYYKKKGMYQHSVKLWSRHIELKSNGIALNIEPLIELAMYYEHHEKNIHQALVYTEEAWEKLRLRRTLSRVERKQSDIEHAITRRMDRLKLKMLLKEQKLMYAAEAEAATVSHTSAHYRETPVKVRGHHTSPKRSGKPRRSKPVYVMESLI